MTASAAGSPLRVIRTLARPASAVVVALGVGFGPWASAMAWASGGSAGNGTGGGTSTLQVQAQELAGQIQADGQTLDQLDASYQAAEINYQHLTAQAEALRQTLAATTAQVAATRDALKQQALLAYLAGGAPVVTQIPDRRGVDPSLTIAYAEIVAGGQKTALANYRATMATQTRQQASLDADTRQMGISLQSIKADVTQATATLAAQQRTLSQVKGQLGVAVATVQAQQQVSEAAQEEATLTAQGVQLPLTQSGASTGRSQAGGRSNTSGPHASPATPAPTAVSQPVAPTAPPPTSAPVTTGTGTRSSGGAGGPPAQAAGVGQVLAYAEAQIGKPYQWGGAGPNAFDCSGLVMMAWDQAGIHFPHLAQDQYNLTAREPLADLEPGDLVFYGTPDDAYHVGIYVGGGNMIDAPETGETVHVQSIYWSALLGAGRVTASS